MPAFLFGCSNPRCGEICLSPPPWIIGTWVNDSYGLVTEYVFLEDDVIMNSYDGSSDSLKSSAATLREERIGDSRYSLIYTLMGETESLTFDFVKIGETGLELNSFRVFIKTVKASEECNGQEHGTL